MLKRSAALLLAGLFVMSGPAFAQKQTMISVSSENPEGDRREIVSKNLPLTESEGAAFWPLYEEYRKSMREVDDKRVALIRKFAGSYQDLTDEAALEMLQEYFAFRRAKVSLQTEYVPKFDAILPSTKVVRYYQVENLIDTMVDFELTRAIPLAH